MFQIPVPVFVAAVLIFIGSVVLVGVYFTLLHLDRVVS